MICSPSAVVSQSVRVAFLKDVGVRRDVDGAGGGRVPVEYEDAPERPVAVAVFKQYAGLTALSRPLLLFGGNIGQRAVVGVAYIAGSMKLTSPAPVAGRMANRERRSAPSATMGIHRFLPFTCSLPCQALRDRFPRRFLQARYWGVISQTADRVNARFAL